MRCTRDSYTLIQEVSVRIYRVSMVTLLTFEMKGNGTILVI